MANIKTNIKELISNLGLVHFLIYCFFTIGFLYLNLEELITGKGYHIVYFIFGIVLALIFKKAITKQAEVFVFTMVFLFISIKSGF